MMERLDLIANSQVFFDNPIFREEEQEFKKKNELDSLALAGLSIAAAGINTFAPGIVSIASFLDR